MQLFFVCLKEMDWQRKEKKIERWFGFNVDLLTNGKIVEHQKQQCAEKTCFIQYIQWHSDDQHQLQ